MIKQLFAFLFILTFTSVTFAACDETITIDSVDYVVSDVWCGKQIDTTQIPKYEDLSRIPEQFSFKDYKIYIRTEAAESFVEMVEAALEDSILSMLNPVFAHRHIRNR